MTKQETQIMKGVAILLMVWVHLCWEYPTLEHHLYVGDKPLLSFLGGATNPVNFFLLLSGYGMHFIYKKGQEDKHRWSRLGKLYAHWIVCVLMFLCIGLVLGRHYNEVGMGQLLLNMTAIDPSWYHPGWFVVPFCLLSLSSFYIFRLTDKFKTIWVLAAAFLFGTCVLYITSRIGSDYIFKNLWMFIPLHYCDLIPAFVFGAMMHRESGKWRISLGKWQWTLWLVLIMVFVAKCFVTTAATGPIYPVIATILFLSAPRKKFVNKTLTFLGNHSLNIWFIHYYICLYIFKEELYSVKYPLLAYVICVLVSIVFSYIVDFVVSIVLRKDKSNI